MPVTRVTVIDAAGAGDPDAPDWLRHADATLARFLSAHRVASANPSTPDPGGALVVRVGSGTGDQVAAGEWTDARDLPQEEPPEPRRRSKHRPAERLAAIMAARDVTLACEELALRARGDLDRGREREAALQLEAALVAALAELVSWREIGDLAGRVDGSRGIARGCVRPLPQRVRGLSTRRIWSRSPRRCRGWRRRCALGPCTPRSSQRTAP